ncbi:hypothetical protein [Streptomyces sp. KR55]|uniref:hypothetical protein n=1 Tax=Streptomyces sp. KR55 TaxID=3457425 RepID=UPI003FD47B85
MDENDPFFRLLPQVIRPAQGRYMWLQAVHGAMNAARFREGLPPLDINAVHRLLRELGWITVPDPYAINTYLVMDAEAIWPPRAAANQGETQ